MSDKTFGNGYDHNATLQFFLKWEKILIWVFCIALVASVVISCLITPKYKATATFIPTNSNRLSKAIMDYHYSMDFMDYGAEHDCEHALQILTSHTMEAAVCERFNLLVHYSISPDDPHKMFKLHERYIGNVSVKRTEFLGVEVNVMDEDPVFAAEIANYITSKYDTVCRDLHHQRAQEAAQIMNQVCADMGREVLELEDSLKRNPQHSMALTNLIEEKCNKLAVLQTRETETRVDKDQEVSYKFMLDNAVVPDKKAYPKRSIIVAIGTLGTLAVAVLALLALDAVKRKED